MLLSFATLACKVSRLAAILALVSVIAKPALDIKPRLDKKLATLGVLLTTSVIKVPALPSFEVTKCTPE